MVNTLIGKTIANKYEIVESLGRGGMAEVFRAYQENLDRHVAIKIMHSFLASEENFLSRFKREARAMASLNHSNIVGVYDFDVQDGMYYIVMEFVSGGTLKQRLEALDSRGERMPLPLAIQLVLEIADALAYAHEQGMVHRDIKPGNIMLDAGGHAVLTDFGIAKIMSGPSFTATGAMIGTPAYMSPEQGLGQTGDERSDLYALGVLFYHMATGRLPYEADTPLAVILKHVNEPVPVPTILASDIPEPIQAVIIKAMAKDPDERYQSARDLATDLKAAAEASHVDLTGAALAVEALPKRAAPALPTPPPVEPPPATVVVPSQSPPTYADATRVSTGEWISETEIAQPTPPQEIAAAPPKSNRRWLFALGGLAAIVIVALIALVALGGGGAEATPTPAAVADVASPTASPTAAETEAAPTADIRGTTDAAVAATLAAAPTDTPLPTGTPEPTETPDLTATAEANCVPQAQLSDFYTYQNPNSVAAPVGARFPMNWIIRNTGDCPLPAGLLWSYLDGEEFGQEGPVELESELPPGQEATLTTNLVAPNSARTYASTWQLKDGTGQAFSQPSPFEISVYTPATPTPRITPTYTPSPTPAIVEPLNFNWSVFGCEYVDRDWICQLSIAPFGGAPPYTVLVADQDPPSEYTGAGPFTHTILSARCRPWVHNLTIRDSGGSQPISQDFFISPDTYFEGGCVPPAP